MQARLKSSAISTPFHHQHIWWDTYPFPITHVAFSHSPIAVENRAFVYRHTKRKTKKATRWMFPTKIKQHRGRVQNLKGHISSSLRSLVSIIWRREFYIGSSVHLTAGDWWERDTCGKAQTKEKQREETDWWKDDHSLGRRSSAIRRVVQKTDAVVWQ